MIPKSFKTTDGREWSQNNNQMEGPNSQNEHDAKVMQRKVRGKVMQNTKYPVENFNLTSQYFQTMASRVSKPRM